ncbi:MAG: helix-turn-helix domain-containing protein [Clostridia bacterium]|nr:helix-turn-helix domain-containing protein [Clostridia bacterium]
MREKMSELATGANIARLRQQQGLTQAALAERLFVSNKTVSKWERGLGYPEITLLPSLARVLGTTVDNLLMGERYGIAILGNILNDIVKLIDFYPDRGMLSNICDMSRAVGGCVPNTAIDLAVMDNSIPISAVGRIGNDESGKYVLGELQRHGIDVSGVRVSPTAPTGFSDVMSVKTTGERTFFHHRGANAEFSPADVKLASLNCKMLHIGYILLLDAFDAYDEEYGTVMARFLASAQAAGIKTSFDVVSDSSGRFAELVTPALRHTDNAFMNEIEGSGVSGIPTRDADGKLILENVRRTMEIILQSGVRERVILHCPEAGFCLNARGEFTVVPSLDFDKSRIKGTVGAGDAFCAGCLWAIYKGLDDRAMLEFASGAACCNLCAEDSVSGMRDKEEIKELICTCKRRVL